MSDHMKDPETTARLAFFTQKRYVSDIDGTGLDAVDATADNSVPASLWGEAWKYLRKCPLFWIAATTIVFSIAMATFPQLFIWIDSNFCESSNSYASPKTGHPSGYSWRGCDIFAHTIRGARVPVIVGLLTTFMVVIIRRAFETLAGFSGDFVNVFLSRIIDIILVIPFILAAIVMMQMSHDNYAVFTMMLVPVVFGWPLTACVTRSAVIQAKNKEFVTAAKALGENKWEIILCHIVSNAIALMIIYTTVALGAFIVSEATPFFLGAGLPSNIVSWGGGISRAQTVLRQVPQALSYPAGVLALTVLSFIMMDDVVRDTLDSKVREK